MRTALVKIIKMNYDRIFQEWRSLLLKDVPDFCLTLQHLSTLVEGIVGYIEGPEKRTLQNAIQEVRQDLGGNGSEHLQLALIKVPKTLKKIMRERFIQPHWMFAFEDILRAAVQEANVSLSPELSVHQHLPSQLEGNTHVDIVMETEASSIIVGNDLEGLLEENKHMFTEIIRSQKGQEEIVRQSLTEHRQSQAEIRRMQQTLTGQQESMAELKLHIHKISNSISAQNGSGVFSSLTSDSITLDSHSLETSVDPKLVEWLGKLGIRKDSIDKILAEDLTLSDMIDLISLGKG